MPNKPCHLKVIASKECLIIKPTGNNVLKMSEALNNISAFYIRILDYNAKKITAQILPESNEANEYVKNFINSNT